MDRDDLKRLGVHAHSVPHLESAFEAQAEHAILAHDTALRRSRLERVRQGIRDLEQRIDKSKSSTRLDKLLTRLEEAQEEERALLTLMNGEERERMPKMATESPQVMPFLASLPSKRTLEPVVIAQASDQKGEDVEMESSSESEEEDAEDDANDVAYRARSKEWCMKNNLPVEYFLKGLHSQCIEAEQAFHAFDLVPIMRDKYYLESRLWNEEMLPYQREGTNWLLENHSKGEGGILADEMGLGKTAQTIMMFAALHISGKLDKPILVVTPTTILRQWMREMRKWWPPLRTIILHPLRTPRSWGIDKRSSGEGVEGDE